jgi:hypothetical protein
VPSLPSAVSENQVPGFGDLATYFLDAKSIVLASERSQDRGGFVAASPDAGELPDLLRDVFVGADAKHPPLEKLIQFNLPVCNVDAADPHLSNPDQDPDCARRKAQFKCNGDEQCLVSGDCIPMVLLLT